MTGRRLSRRTVLQGAAGAGLLAAFAPVVSACGDPSDDAARLVFLNWQDYIDPHLLRDFERADKATVAYDTYASNDELSQRLSQAQRTRRGGRKSSSFDLIVPSDNLFRELRDGDQLEALPKDLKGRANLGADFRALPFDPGNRFTVPWATGTTGIGYSRKAFPDGPPGWDVFLDPAVSGKASILDETRDAMAVGAFLLDEDPNSEDRDVITKEGEQLAKAKANGVAFDSATYLDGLASGARVVAEAYSTDVLQAQVGNDDLAFVVPDVGGLRWIDCLCVPDDAPHPDLAFRFIAYYLTPDVAAANSVAIKADTGNEAAAKFLPAAVKDDPIIVVSGALAKRTVFTSNPSKAVSDAYAAAFGDAKG